MQNSKYVWMAMVVVAIIALGSYQFQKVNQSVNQVLGAVPTLDGVDHPYIKVNGQQEWRGTVSMKATSTILCSIRNPYTGTSTINHLSAEVTARGNLNQANSLVVSTSTDAFSTSTTNLVHDYAMGTGQFSMVLQKNSATSTAGTTNTWGVRANLLPGMQNNGATNYVIKPGEYVNFVVATSSLAGGTFVTYMTGNCSAQFEKI